MWRQIAVFVGFVVGICYCVPVDDPVAVDNLGLPEDTPLDTISLNEYRFHEGKNRYFKIGSTHVCNQNMRFFAHPKVERLGICDCDWLTCSRPLLYHNDTDTCYWAWSTGPCSTGEWYTFGEKMLPICEKYPCPSETPITETDKGSSFIFLNPKDSKCYEAGTKGYCKEDEGILMIYPQEPIPICRTSTVCNALTFPQTVQCIQGNKWHQTPNSGCTYS